uniref:Uncharacterized protein n=1 Tax=Rhizophora mucronata TaxID=61149 RepID=A0A2P2M8J1_RHIMU
MMCTAEIFPTREVWTPKRKKNTTSSMTLMPRCRLVLYLFLSLLTSFFCESSVNLTF